MNGVVTTAACVAIVAASAVFDWFTRRIPNVLTLGGVALGIGIHAALGFVDGPHAALRAGAISLFGAILCAILPGIGFWRGDMGGGDVKLFAAIGAMLGPTVGFDAQALTFVIVLLVIWPYRLAKKGVFRRFFAQIFRRGAKTDFKVDPVVLGPAIFCGLCAAVLRHGAFP